MNFNFINAFVEADLCYPLRDMNGTESERGEERQSKSFNSVFINSAITYEIIKSQAYQESFENL